MQLQRLLDDLVDEATIGQEVSTAELSPADIRALLADRLQGRPTRANFRTGHLTICTLVPMRSVPHRVVCLLGLDDGSFPRNIERDGDDLIAADPHVGDRDARSEDRQLLLDALLAATERLIITYTGTGRAHQPAAASGGAGRRAARRDRPNRDLAGPRGLPASTFDPPSAPAVRLRNFTPGALVAGRPWSFDAVNLEGARALDTPGLCPARSLPAPLADAELPTSSSTSSSGSSASGARVPAYPARRVDRRPGR